MAPTFKKSLPKHPHLLIPACRACRVSKRACVITASEGSRIRSCDRCRSCRKRCISDEPEADQRPVSVGKKRRRADGGDLNELKGKKFRTQKQFDEVERGAMKDTDEALEDEGRRDMPEAAGVGRPTRLETTLRELTTNTTALTEAITQNMTAILEERRERAECDRRTSETMNLMLKVVYKIVDAGDLPSASRET